MQISLFLTVAQSTNTEAMYLLKEIAKNKIGDEGCEFLSTIDWPCLRVLKIHKNQISDQGINHLRRANWP